MRSLSMIKVIFAFLGTSFLAGCFVSEEPMLTASNGHATPLHPGPYEMCPIEEDADLGDCQQFSVEHDAGGLYLFIKQDEEPAQMRFRRVGRKGYAIQSHEGDAYAYYYGSGDSKGFHLVMMMCQGLAEKPRARLIKQGHLSSDDDDFETCTVNSLRGLTGAARAYHRGKAVSDDGDIGFTIMPLLITTDLENDA